MGKRKSWQTTRTTHCARMLRLRGSGWVLIPTASPDVETRLPGHVTFKPGEPTGGMARRARISSQASQQEGWLDKLTFRARRANRRDGLTSSHFEPGEPTGGMARRARISSQASQQEGWLDKLTFRARQANRRDGSTSSHFKPGEPTGVMA